MKRNKIIGGVVVSAALGIGLGFGIQAALAQPPTQIIRTGPDVANWCASFGSNHVVYDWNQAQCPAGTYPVSIVSMPQAFTLDINGHTVDCVLSATSSAGIESDAITCSGPALVPKPTPTATVTVTATPSVSPSASPSVSPSPTPTPTSTSTATPAT